MTGVKILRCQKLSSGNCIHTMTMCEFAIYISSENYGIFPSRVHVRYKNLDKQPISKYCDKSFKRTVIYYDMFLPANWKGIFMKIILVD